MKVLPLRCGLDDHVEMVVPSPVGNAKLVSPISSFLLNTLTLKVRFKVQSSHAKDGQYLSCF